MEEFRAYLAWRLLNQCALSWNGLLALPKYVRGKAWSLHSCQVRLAVLIFSVLLRLGQSWSGLFPGWSATCFLNDFVDSLLRLWRSMEMFTLGFLCNWAASLVHRDPRCGTCQGVGSWGFQLLHELSRVRTLRRCLLSFRWLYWSSSIDKNWAELKRKIQCVRLGP